MELVQVGCDDVRLGRLFQLYVYDWSSRLPIAIGEDALFFRDALSKYRGGDSAIYLILDGPTPVGFAIAVREDAAHRVEDFFVIAGARRRGLGTAAARALFAARPGPWTLTVRAENPGALSFWRRAAPAPVERIEPGDDGVTRTRLSFVAP